MDKFLRVYVTMAVVVFLVTSCNDIARRDGFFMVLRRLIRRMNSDENHQAFGGRLYGDFAIIDDYAEFLLDNGIRTDDDVDRHRLYSPDVED